MRRARSASTRYGAAIDPPTESRVPTGRSDPPSQLSAQATGHVPIKIAGEIPAGNISQRDSREPRIARRDKFSRELIADAGAIFSRRLGRPVSHDEARALLGDLTDYYELAVVRHRTILHRQPSKADGDDNSTE